MEQLFVSYNPILILVAIVLTILAAYTALDLFTLIRSSEPNKRFLFLGGTFSLGIGIWVMHFIGLLAMDLNTSITYHIPITILSMLLGIFFTGVSFFLITGKTVNFRNLIVSSLVMTLTIFVIHFLGINAMNLAVEYNYGIVLLSASLIFGSFFFSLSILFNTKNGIAYNFWLKPLSAIIISAAIAEGHFLLIRATSLYVPTDEINQLIQSQENLIVYLVIFVSILILAGLLGSSTLITRKLSVSDTNLEDIKFALDESSIVAITDPKGRITYANDKFCEISKYEEHELIGNNHSILNSGYHSKAFFLELWRTISSGNVWKGEIRNKAKDGSYYWVDTTIVPFMNKKNKPFQYVSIRTDITDKKLAEEELRNTVKEVKDIKFALDQSTIVAITNEKGIITNVNDKFCEISKYSKEELIGNDHAILNSGLHSKHFFKDLWKTIGQGEVWKGEIRNKAKDGTYYWVDTTIVPFVNEQGKPYQYLSIRNDITKRKKSEELLHRQDKLAAVGQLAAGVAHEIRNPLTSMKGYAEFLQLDETSEERREYLDIILDEIDRVNEIVEEFMVLAKPKAHELQNKNIVPILSNVVSLLEFEARKKNIRLHFDALHEIVQVECDENRLKQVFINFVKNAIEAMPNGGDIRVKTTIEDNDVQISIQDTGIGIPQEKLKKLGEPFFTTKEKGNGLGLMVSFKIIESHNGKVYVESELNKGTTFNIVLPAAKSA